MTTYKPGSFFLARIPGVSGYLINLGQALAGDSSRWSHAGIILNSSGLALEAEPGGARLAMLSEYEGRPLLISDAPVRQWALAWAEAHPGASRVPIPEKRAAIIREAQALRGVPYSALDYLALAALHLHLPSAAIRRRVESSGHLMCSALVDLCFLRAGIHLFNDGRFPGDVLPSDLAAYAEDWQAAR